MVKESQTERFFKEPRMVLQELSLYLYYSAYYRIHSIRPALHRYCNSSWTCRMKMRMTRTIRIGYGDDDDDDDEELGQMRRTYCEQHTVRTFPACWNQSIEIICVKYV